MNKYLTKYNIQKPEGWIEEEDNFACVGMRFKNVLDVAFWDYKTNSMVGEKNICC